MQNRVKLLIEKLHVSNMGDERHVIIQEPDGSLVVGFNDEIPPPPPPEEIVITIPDEQIAVIKYSLVNAVITDFFVLTGMGTLIAYRRYHDTFNIIFGLMTSYAFHRKPVPPQLTFSQLIGSLSYHFIMGTFFLVSHMWWESTYQFCCGMNIVLALFICEEITI